MSEQHAQSEPDRPCDQHRAPSKLGAIWCSACGAFRPTSYAPLRYMSRARCQPYFEGVWTRPAILEDLAAGDELVERALERLRAAGDVDGAAALLDQVHEVLARAGRRAI